MSPKGAKGANHQVGPKSQVGPPEPILAPNLNVHKHGQKDPGTKIGHLSTTKGHRRKPIKISPQFMGRTLLHQRTPYQRIQVWCMYGIIYHYEPDLLRNPMVMFSGPNYAFLNSCLQTITHSKGILFSHSVLQSLAATRRPFEGPNHPALQELGFIVF
ncbi:hypothetical protein O181_039570 [Austropuccinia psidii MF-1]|uniref:Uncharacterized protein n=1 Tax=Austropuccinia psidii MF-1 TaxID=1389203 RepID=A0A9Q3HFA6_9BASI|nr:hypothetical protein [Austropuccinia psidii MF-1]